MKWKGREGSSNVEDRRGSSSGGGKRFGGATTIIAIIITLLYTSDPLVLLQQGLDLISPEEQSTTTYTPSAQDQELAEFVSVVLKTTEDVWEELFRTELGKTYQQPTLVIFSNSVTSACGNASAATGPFYCPGDNQLYIDLSFYQDLTNKFGASGDFAMAYVVAHEVAHHVQNLLNITDQVHAQKGRITEKDYNQLSVKLELQADFLAGVWAHHAQRKMDILEEGDIEEALNAAHAIGDDRLQKQARGYVTPDSFTHGTSAQRMKWFKKGFQTGDIDQGDTFGTNNL